MKKLQSDTLQWRKFCKDFPKLRNIYLKNINFALKQELEELNKADQENYQYKIGRPSNPVAEDSICIRLFQIITENGYPNHDIIGLNIKNDTILQPLIYEVILIHLLQTKNQYSPQVLDIIFNAVIDNKIEVEHAINWLDISYWPYSFYGYYLYTRYENYLFVYNPDFEKRNYDFFNLNRQKINACSIEEEVQKKVYKYKNPNSKFIFNLDKFHVDQYIYPIEQRISTKIDLDGFSINEFRNIFKNSTILNNDNNNIALVEYFRLINLADLSICDGDYKKACELYSAALINNQNPFPKDIYNLILANIYNNDNETAVKYCKELVKLGIGPKFFNQKTFDKIKENKKLWKRFEKEIPQIQKKYSKNINKEVKNELDGLIRSMTENFENEKDIINTFEYDIFNKIIENHGYPGHKLIGVCTYNDTIISKPNGILSVYYQTHSGLEGQTSLLLKEVYLGNLHPVEFLSIVKYSYIDDILFGTPLICKDKEGNYFLKNVDELRLKNTESIYNDNRKKSLNCSINDEIKKIIFMQKHSDLKFSFYISEIHEIENILPYQLTNTFKKINLDDY
ncbi:MAG: hypothetical protein IPH57_01510 [Saprospiraceae bacterium]|nr:hypothetical protein [Saprospiraceae bacterium]